MHAYLLYGFPKLSVKTPHNLVECL